LNRLYQDYIDQLNLKGFAEVICAPSVRHGMQALMLSAGIGGMKPNTVVLGFFDESQVPTEVVCVIIFTSSQTSQDEAAMPAVAKALPPLRAQGSEGIVCITRLHMYNI